MESSTLDAWCPDELRLDPPPGWRRRAALMLCEPKGAAGCTANVVVMKEPRGDGESVHLLVEKLLLDLHGAPGLHVHRHRVTEGGAVAVELAYERVTDDGYVFQITTLFETEDIGGAFVVTVTATCALEDADAISPRLAAIVAPLRGGGVSAP